MFNFLMKEYVLRLLTMFNLPLHLVRTRKNNDLILVGYLLVVKNTGRSWDLCSLRNKKDLVLFLRETALTLLALFLSVSPS
jgi:hypothetical protein